MADNQQYQEAPTPSEKVKALDRLVGTWELSGDSTGTVTYRWMDGGFFLIQDFDITVFGERAQGVEYIGHLRPFGQDPSEDVHSRVFDTQGNTLDYTYEIVGDKLTIWGGERGSPAYFEGTFSKDGNTNEGAWHYPGGGGYSTTMTRKK